MIGTVGTIKGRQGTFLTFLTDNLVFFKIIGQKIKEIARYYSRNLRNILTFGGGG